MDQELGTSIQHHVGPSKCPPQRLPLLASVPRRAREWTGLGKMALRVPGPLWPLCALHIHVDVTQTTLSKDTCSRSPAGLWCSPLGQRLSAAF